MQASIIRELGQATKAKYAVVAALVALLIGGGVWISTAHRHSELVDLTEESCAYDITDTGDDLTPSIDGKRIGTFERHGNGDVQLTLGNGFSPKANACIEKAGLGDRISSIRKYR